MHFIRTTFLGHDLALWLPENNWAQSPELTYTLASKIETAESGRENRAPTHACPRHKISAKWTIPAAETAAWLAGTANLGTAHIAIPIPTDRLTPADYADRIHSSQVLVAWNDTGDFRLLLASALQSTNLSTFTHLAPLYVGRLADNERPTLRALNDQECEFTLTLDEQSPWDFRIAPAPITTTLTDTWPAILDPNWRELPEDTTKDTLTTETLGQGRTAALDGHEGAPRRSQKFLVTLDGREQIRTFLNFFRDRQAQVRSFIIPWCLTPSEDDTPETPHSTRVRFATDNLTLKYLTDELAEAFIEVLELPWEINLPAGEKPEQPPVAYLYRFSIDVPGGGHVWRYTDWESDIEVDESTIPATSGSGSSPIENRESKIENYQGDLTALIEHDQITKTIDLGDDPTTLTSWDFPGNPLARILQRALDVPLAIDIHECNPLDPAPVPRHLYSGRIAEVTMEGRKYTATTTVLGGKLEIKVPNFFYSITCNHGFCRAGCQLKPADWTFTATVESITAATLTIAITGPRQNSDNYDDFFRRGWISKGGGLDYELRAILASARLGAGRWQLTLKRPLRNIQPGDTITLQPACSGTIAECQRYNNYINFGGHPHMGPENLSLPSKETSPAGGKK